MSATTKQPLFHRPDGTVTRYPPPVEVVEDQLQVTGRPGPLGHTLVASRFGHLKVDSWAFHTNGHRDVDAHLHLPETVEVNRVGTTCWVAGLSARDEDGVQTKVVLFLTPDQLTALAAQAAEVADD